MRYDIYLLVLRDALILLPDSGKGLGLGYSDVLHATEKRYILQASKILALLLPDLITKNSLSEVLPAPSGASF